MTSASVLIAPALVQIEVNGAILRRYREGSCPWNGLKKPVICGTQTLQPSALRLIPDEALISPARAIAFQIRHAIQDCLYLAAAIEDRRRPPRDRRPQPSTLAPCLHSPLSVCRQRHQHDSEEDSLWSNAHV